MRRLFLVLICAAAIGTAACSGGGSTINPPPPTGKYSLASLNGFYTFITSGEVCAGCIAAATPMSRVGSFVADGKGGISGGIEDVNIGGTPSAPVGVTGGSYTVNPDGRGTVTLSFGQSSIDFGIVLTSTSDGLMIDETSNSSQASTGSGNFVLQQSTPFTLSEFTGNYVFDFTGFDGATPTPNPESFVGQFSADGSLGTIPTGLFDDNDGTQLSGGTMVPGTIAPDPSQPSAFTNFGRGIAKIAGQNFVFYIIDANRIRFLSTSNGMLSGDATWQSSIPASVSGDFAFLVGGSSPNGGLTRVARFTSSGNALSKMLMDVNDASNEIQFNGLRNGSVTAYDSTTGRGHFSFQDSNGQIYSFVFYFSSPSAAVIQDVSPSATANFARVVADGSLLVQSAGPFTSSITGTYALNWSGLVTAGGTGFTDEEDLLGQVTISNLTLSGTSDAFQFTSNTLTPALNKGTAGQIAFLNGNGTGNDGNRVNMDVSLSGQSAVHTVVYIVSPQFAFFANRDNNGSAPRVVAGVLEAQQ